MENTNILVKTDLGIIDYATIVDAIVEEYFDDEGNYTPHIGKMNAMRLFYNYCVIESKFDIEHTIFEALQMQPLVEDSEFINSFNKAIQGDGKVRLDFANAYSDAIKIVDTKKGSFGNAVETIKGAVSNIIDMINPVLGTDNIEKFKQIADSLTNGNLSVDTIVEAFGNKDENK